MQETVYTNAQIVLADRVVRGSLQVRNGQIAAIETTASRAPGAIDFAGDLLIPGLIELHTDNMERHIMPRPSTYWPIDAAVLNHDREIAAAGITTVFDALSLGYMQDYLIKVQTTSPNGAKTEFDRVYFTPGDQVPHPIVEVPNGPISVAALRIEITNFALKPAGGWHMHVFAMDLN